MLFGLYSKSNRAGFGFEFPNEILSYRLCELVTFAADSSVVPVDEITQGRYSFTFDASRD